MPLPASAILAPTQPAHSETIELQEADAHQYEEVAPVIAAKPAKKPAADTDASSEGSDKNNSAADSTVRIDVNVLDRLMNLVGELVLARI